MAHLGDAAEGRAVQGVGPFAGGVEAVHVPGDDVAVVPLAECDEVAQRVGRELVVRVGEHEPCAACEGGAVVACVSEPLIVDAVVLDAEALLRVAPRDGSGAVG